MDTGLYYIYTVVETPLTISIALHTLILSCGKGTEAIADQKHTETKVYQIVYWQQGNGLILLCFKGLKPFPYMLPRVTSLVEIRRLQIFTIGNLNNIDF